MYFILNKMVKFLPATSELSLVNDVGNSVLLSKAATRLLNELVKRSPEIVSREFLLKSVWEDYGYTPSYNNLYMAVSELRKSFSILGEVNDVIITVPKSGLRFDATIDILERNNLAPEEEVYSTLDPENTVISLADGESVNSRNLIPEELDPIRPIKYSPSFLLAKTLFLFFILLIGVMVYFWNKQTPFVVTTSQDKIFFKKGVCDIYLIDAIDGYNVQKVKDQINSVMKKYDVDCYAIKKNIYFQISFPRFNVLEEATMAICVNDGKIKSCETIKKMAG